MKKNITLSSIVNVRPIVTKNPFDDWALYDYVNLYRYAPSCYSACPNIIGNILSSASYRFFQLPHIVTVANLFATSEHTKILQYKLGELPTKDNQTQTEAFTELLMDAFPFLAAKNNRIPQSVIDELWQHKNRYPAIASLEDRAQFTRSKIAEALLQKIWCAQFSVSEYGWQKIDFILQSGDTIILSTDGNPMHIFYLTELIKEKYPNLGWINDSTELPKQVAPNLYFAESWGYHTFSTELNNTKFKVNKPAYIHQLKDKFSADQLEFISHFKFNRDEATELGMKITTAEDFFPKAHATTPNKKGN